jgi:hypothetical protein
MFAERITIKIASALFLTSLLALAPACSGGGGGGSAGGGPEEPPSETDLWSTSGHADFTAEAFNHWDEDEPPEIPTSCAKCHNTTGFNDFLGADGSTERVVDNSVPIDPDVDNVLGCPTCHNAKTFTWDTVVFPSGATVTGLGRYAMCMECHSGRESTLSVDAEIADAGVPDDDTVSTDIGFKNIHYYAAAATQYGGTAMGGYQYVGNSYDVKFAHVEGVDTCTTCHDPHSTDIQIETCAACHTDVTTSADLANIRMLGSLKDYDGDGDTTEGIPGEIGTFRENLYSGMQNYATDVAGSGILYDSSSYPYFFIDTNGNGIADPGEINYGNKYNAWTGRLLKAAFNFQFSLKDPGVYAHNGKYVLQLAYDSIENLNSALAPGRQIDLSGANRIDAGHFAGSEEAWRHWDVDGEVSAGCSKCHSATGLPYYLANGTTQTEPLSNGMLCSTCHDNLLDFSSQRTVASVTFPSGEIIDSGSNTNNLCMTCHQGRASKISVDEEIADAAPADDDTVDGDLSFQNVHYFAAGATRYGTEVQGGYEYDGLAYDGYFPHVSDFAECSDCHSTHRLEENASACGECHVGVTTMADIADIRMAGSTEDYDGDGNDTEGISFEIVGLRDDLYTAIQAYASAHPVANPILYDGHTYPYFFVDTNDNGVADPGEVSYGNRYQTWTARMLKAAYNMQYTLKDPGGSAHNAKYVIELLYDSMSDLGADVSAYSRNDYGHFDSSSESFRHWDGDGEVSGSCARCHAPPHGIDYYLANGVDSPDPMPISDGLTCETCHIGDNFSTSAPRRYVAQVEFPSGNVILNNPADPDDSFLCMTCHQGRESKATIDEAIANGDLAFKNVHYLAAGATLYGSQAEVGYEYDGNTYAGKFDHNLPVATAQCSFCHEIEADNHTFEAELKTTCTVICHTEATGGDIETIRLSRPIDYDGDGNNTEKLKDELATLSSALYTQIQTYASITLGAGILYDAGSYPYFFIDTNGNGIADPGEVNYGNKYTAWDGKLMKAAHNFQHSLKEHGAWAHNTDYIVQLLIDSIADLGGNVSGFNRP